MQPIVFLNGILTDGAQNIDKLYQRFKEKGYPAVDASYPIVTPWSARWRARGIVKSLLPWVEEGSSLVGHSYAGVLIGLLAERVPLRTITLIGSAANKEWDWANAKGSPDIVNWYSPSDHVVRLGSWIPFRSPFGAAGVDGYSSPLVKNIKRDSDHNDYFDEPLITEIEENLAARLGVV